MNSQTDLTILVADSDAEWAIRTLLDKRHIALGIRRVNYELLRDPRHDPGVCRHTPDLLRPYLLRSSYALVMFDYEGCGREDQLSAINLEETLEDSLRRNGWITSDGASRAAVVAIDPELEAWVWTRSIYVAQAMGLSEAGLVAVLQNFPKTERGKPERPKEAMLAALRKGNRPHSADIFRELAQKVSLQAYERAFDKLRQTLQGWFPAGQV